KAASVATSTVSDAPAAASAAPLAAASPTWFTAAPVVRCAGALDTAVAGYRVHSSTLFDVGSAEATPSGKRSRRSCQVVVEGLPLAAAMTAAAPRANAVWMNSLRQ